MATYQRQSGHAPLRSSAFAILLVLIPALGHRSTPGWPLDSPTAYGQLPLMPTGESDPRSCAGCAAGNCIPHATTFGHYRTIWRRWPEGSSTSVDSRVRRGDTSGPDVSPPDELNEIRLQERTRAAGQKKSREGGATPKSSTPTPNPKTPNTESELPGTPPNGDLVPDVSPPTETEEQGPGTALPGLNELPGSDSGPDTNSRPGPSDIDEIFPTSDSRSRIQERLHLRNDQGRERPQRNTLVSETKPRSDLNAPLTFSDSDLDFQHPNTAITPATAMTPATSIGLVSFESPLEANSTRPTSISRSPIEALPIEGGGGAGGVDSNPLRERSTPKNVNRRATVNPLRR